MRKGWAVRVLTPVACAAIVACGGSDGANVDRRANAPDRRPNESAATVALSGCVAAAPGTANFVLRNVRFEPRHGGDPHMTTTTAGGHGITEGAWVRLVADRDMKDFLGQRVTLKGAVTDDGRNTIGTAGTPGVPTASGDRSQAASDEHHAEKKKKEMGRIGRESMADGTAAAVRVTDIQGTGERCVSPPER